jgi:hypothetical protein
MFEQSFEVKPQPSTPLPAEDWRKETARVFPFLYTMKVGDCVLLEGKVNRQSLKASRAYAKKRYGTKFAVRAFPEGLKVWRTA